MYQEEIQVGAPRPHHSGPHREGVLLPLGRGCSREGPVGEAGHRLGPLPVVSGVVFGGPSGLSPEPLTTLACVATSPAWSLVYVRPPVQPAGPRPGLLLRVHTAGYGTGGVGDHGEPAGQDVASSRAQRTLPVATRPAVPSRCLSDWGFSNLREGRSQLLFWQNLPIFPRWPLSRTPSRAPPGLALCVPGGTRGPWVPRG